MVHKLHKHWANSVQENYDQRRSSWGSSFISLEEVAVYLHRRVLWPNIFLIFIMWMNWRTLQPITSLVGVWSRVLRFPQLVSHVLGSCASKRGTVTTEQFQLGIRVRVQLSVGKVLGIPLLVTACYDNSRVSGVVIWKSPGGVFAIRFFPIRKQITVLFIFHCLISLLVIFLCYHAFAW